MRNVNFAWLTNANFLEWCQFSHAEAGATDEGDDEGGDPGQKHVWPAAAKKYFTFFYGFFFNTIKT